MHSITPCRYYYDTAPTPHVTMFIRMLQVMGEG